MPQPHHVPRAMRCAPWVSRCNVGASAYSGTLPTEYMYIYKTGARDMGGGGWRVDHEGRGRERRCIRGYRAIHGPVSIKSVSRRGGSTAGFWCWLRASLAGWWAVRGWWESGRSGRSEDGTHADV